MMWGGEQGVELTNMTRVLEEDLCLLGHAPCGSLSPRSVFSETGYSLLRAYCVPAVHHASSLTFTSFV